MAFTTAFEEIKAKSLAFDRLYCVSPSCTTHFFNEILPNSWHNVQFGNSTEFSDSSKIDLQKYQ